MKINYLSVRETTPPSGYWDQTFIADLLADLPEGDREVFLIPGAYQGDQDAIDKINVRLKQFSKVMVFLTSDEERKFDCSKLSHPDMILYCQYGGCEHIFPIGYTGETRKQLQAIGLVDKDIDYFYAGQLNSNERKNMFSGLAMLERAVLFGTAGFSQGLKPPEYYNYLAHSKFAPCPPGWISPDSFRFYEALEAGCIPTHFPPYMNQLFPSLPFGQVGSNQFFAWWVREKQRIKRKLRNQLGCAPFATTVVITTSPIPSHPSMRIIDETIKSIRHYLDCEIIIAIDGVRPEQEERRRDYDLYVQKLLWVCNFRYKNIVPVVFDTHKHQSGMMKEVLPMIKTPLLLFAEHDTPLVTDEDIDFPYLQEKLLAAEAFMIRFHFEAVIPKPHKHLMLGEPKDRLLPTAQWSQRPHLARVDFYKECMKFFSDESNCFIEDLLHGRLQDANELGEWDKWKVFIYYPDEKNIKRSLNLDGRGDDKKYDDRQIW